jgi:hypothetical protein
VALPESAVPPPNVQHPRQRAKLAPDLSPASAVMLATRIFFNYFSIEILFGVKDHFGKGTEETIGDISRILRHGMLKEKKATVRVAKATKPAAKPLRRARA